MLGENHDWAELPRGVGVTSGPLTSEKLRHDMRSRQRGHVKLHQHDALMYEALAVNPPALPDVAVPVLDPWPPGVVFGYGGVHSTVPFTGFVGQPTVETLVAWLAEGAHRYFGCVPTLAAAVREIIGLFGVSDPGPTLMAWGQRIVAGVLPVVLSDPDCRLFGSSPLPMFKSMLAAIDTSPDPAAVFAPVLAGEVEGDDLKPRRLGDGTSIALGFTTRYPLSDRYQLFHAELFAVLAARGPVRYEL